MVALLEPMMMITIIDIGIIMTETIIEIMIIAMVATIGIDEWSFAPPAPNLLYKLKL